MDPIMIPHGLFIFYGALVLSCGGGLGFILGRNSRRKDVQNPHPSDELERRLTVLESELGAAQSELSELGTENRFLRELAAPPARKDERRLHRDVA